MPLGSRLTFVFLFLCSISNIDLASTASRKCEDSLATPLPYSSFTGSSVYATGYGAGYAKLNRRGGSGGWSPVDADRYQWLQVDLGSRKKVVAVATQGRYSSADWTRRYRLLYSDTGKNWRPFLQDGNIWTFEGNSDSEGVTRHELLRSIVARYVRFVPLQWSKEGRMGLRVEVYGCSYWSDVVSFDGQGVISYRFSSKTKKIKFLTDLISLKFRTSAGHGVLLHGEGQQGDYISLELQRARLDGLHIELSHTSESRLISYLLISITIGSLLDDDHWHSVLIQRYRRNVNFTLDQHTQPFRTNGEFDHLDLDYEISFGGLPASNKPSSGGRDNFVGCMEGIVYNGDNITSLIRRKKVDTSSFRNLTFSCSESRSFPVFFNSSSFLQLPGQGDSDTLSVSLSFRTWNPSGLLVYTALADEPSLYLLSAPHLVYGFSALVPRPTVIRTAERSNLNDGQWHTVHLNALENYAMLTIDGDEASTVRTAIPIQITTGGTYYFGGYFLRTNTPPLQRSFQGCMQMIHVDDQLADLRAVEQGLIGMFQNVSLDMCAIIDRCVPNQCEHGGRCSQTWDSFSCICNGTGYRGATCHTSVYQQSCEEVLHLGRAPGGHWVDPDGSGPLQALRVSCDLTGRGTGTHATLLRSVQFVYFTFSQRCGSSYKVYAVTSGADYCEQHIAYTCRMSRLLNSPDGEPYTWWVGRANEKHLYWGGSGPGIQKCACGIERNCTSAKHQCNCDADQRQWREDAGLLVYKDHLPVSQLVVGDTGRAGSEAKLTVGPLRCRGDRDFWNAASFISPASYLHFPSLKGETSADISFYFKTSSTYGVFLENLGTTDFIRIELKATSVISFSFDVGNGGVELTVRSPSRLDDGRWHRVEAERNLKEAVLSLDGRYRDARAAPAQGHIRLELFSQLYIGASGGQRGFLGCMRALRLNGVTLDLEERARVTPGVKPGCQGHCNHFGVHCRNGGVCVEQYDGYSCDCSHTAYDGRLCTNDVGGYFESGTLVRYDFPSEAGPPASGAAPRGPQGTALLGETNLTREELVFSFSTSNAPAILVYVSSKTQDYLAVVLRNNGTLQVRYSLGGLTEPYTIDLDHRNMANGQPHHVNVSREQRSADQLLLLPPSETGEIDPVLIDRYNTPGFVGCLSRVTLNGVAPLKAALRPGPAAALVTAHGILVPSNCGAQPLTISPLGAAHDPCREKLDHNSAVIGGIVAVVICLALGVLVFLVRHMFRHKGSYHTNEAKGAESADCADAAIIVNDPAFTETIEESKKEWFI
uniref:Contactin-associated protein-like 2 n=1 Tax=Gadus morhua TaxID=8049 RepID=A0A8C5CP98_GADMO